MTPTDELPMMEIKKKFWDRVEKSDGCWLWTGTRARNGYGRMRWINGKSKPATHIAWLVETGELPPAGMMMCHHCDNPPCVRIDHLFLGTAKDNVHDRERKGRGFPPPRAPLSAFARGERHPKTILREDDIRAIRRATQTNRASARQFGVSEQTISRIKLGGTWGHVK